MLYPNPSTNYVVLHGVVANAQTLRLYIYDITGRSVWNETIVAQGSFSKEINVSALPSGVYSFSLSDEKFLKFVKY